jgi:hypothetical protein
MADHLSVHLNFAFVETGDSVKIKKRSKQDKKDGR